MDKEPTVPKLVLINQPKIPQMPPKIFWQNLSDQAQKYGIFKKKPSLWVSAVRGQDNSYLINFEFFF